MSWSYLSTAPNSSDKSWIRLRVGDTSSGTQLLQDEEIDAHLEAEGNRYSAAALCAESIGAAFARRADKTVGRLSIAMSKVSERYFTLADRLRSELGMRALPYAGGISVADKEVDQDDADRVAPAFTVDMLEFGGDAEGSESARD